MPFFVKFKFKQRCNSKWGNFIENDLSKILIIHFRSKKKHFERNPFLLRNLGRRPPTRGKPDLVPPELISLSLNNTHPSFSLTFSIFEQADIRYYSLDLEPGYKTSTCDCMQCDVLWESGPFVARTAELVTSFLNFGLVAFFCNKQ